MKIADSVPKLVGNVSTGGLDGIRLEMGLIPLLLAVCKYFSAGGSVKDRTAPRMNRDFGCEDKLTSGDVRHRWCVRRSVGHRRRQRDGARLRGRPP